MTKKFFCLIKKEFFLNNLQKLVISNVFVKRHSSTRMNVIKIRKHTHLKLTLRLVSHIEMLDVHVCV